MTNQWHKTASLGFHFEVTRDDDWTLVDAETGEHLAQVYNTGDNDLYGPWRWRTSPFNRPECSGRARNFREAKWQAEAQLASQKD
jgi:hypothetical protein